MIASQRVYRTADGAYTTDETLGAFLAVPVGHTVPADIAAQLTGEKPQDVHTAKPDATVPATPEKPGGDASAAVAGKIELPSRSGSREEWAEAAIALGIDPGELKRNELIALVNASGVK